MFSHRIGRRTLARGASSAAAPTPAHAVHRPPPRCGCEVLEDRVLLYNATGWWNTPNITYSYGNLFDPSHPFAPALTEPQIRGTIEEALSLWASVMPLRFFEVQEPSIPTVDDAAYTAGSGVPMIRFGHHAIDGTLGTLAHTGVAGQYQSAGASGQGQRGDVHFDTDEPWSLNPTTGIDLLEVAVHEVGHALGLDHYDPGTPLMHTNYQGRYSGPGSAYLTTDDIQGITAAYSHVLGSETGTGYVRPADGRVVIRGTNEIDVIGAYVVGAQGDGIQIQANGFTYEPSLPVTGVDVYLRGGDDAIIADAGLTTPFRIAGGAGYDYIESGAGDDQLFGDGGYDELHGGAGNDYLVGGSEGDVIEGGAGVDVTDYRDHAGPVTITVGAGRDDGLRGPNGEILEDDDVQATVEQVHGSNFRDFIDLAQVAADGAVDGEAGDDLIYGGAYNDLLVGGLGNDKMVGYAGSDTFSGGDGDRDEVSYLIPSTTGIFVTFDNYPNDGFLDPNFVGPQNPYSPETERDNVLEDVEIVQGSDHPDYIDASNQTRPMFLDGRDGADVLIGGWYDDFLVGSAGPDILDGGPDGNDIASYEDHGAAVVVTVGNGADDGVPGEGDNVLDNIETVYGTAFGDRMEGLATTQHFYGRAGNDTLIGAQGSDELFGEDGDDLLWGDLEWDDGTGGGGNGYGNDLIYGGVGNDQIHGGYGNDALFGDDGDDHFYTNDGMADAIHGGNGNDEAISHDLYDANPGDVEYWDFY